MPRADDGRLGLGTNLSSFMPHPSMVLPHHPATALVRHKLVPSFSGKLALARETERGRLRVLTLGHDVDRDM
ncbi:hypothetical protein MPL1032_10179 [Mesorhizobium plurifarium]|uniref:Uncharacterized protein n=1 Tax=Mesorhizobium plurifarium TaxID=69974 RepID=A0A0K2VMM1_MESPL|nr:hypothetical protein MPL1032_10179 [Mesorhizobium plurifarium]